MRIYNDEQFGPVSPIVVFDNLSEPIQFVKKSPLRQQAAVFGQYDLRTESLVRVLGNLVCRVNTNSQCQRGPDELPFAGKRDSGVRELSVSEALLAFTDPSVIAGEDNETNRAIIGLH
jgi:glyceraldehyde-3-phosphate dehydrogenase (NADP+)